MKQLATLTLSLLYLFVTAQNDRKIIGYESRAIQLAWPYVLSMQNDYDTTLQNCRFLDIGTKFTVVDTISISGKPAVYKIRLQSYKQTAVDEFDEFKKKLEQIGINEAELIEADELKSKFDSYIYNNKQALNSAEKKLNAEKDKKDDQAKAVVTTLKSEVDSLKGCLEIGDYNSFYKEYNPWYFEEDIVNGKTVLRLITEYKNYPSEYFIKQDGFTKNNVPIYVRSEFSLGVITIPIKVRFGGDVPNGRVFDFGADASLGLNFGYKFNFSKYVKDGGAFNIMSGVSITAVQVTPETTSGKVAEKTMVAAITIPLGVVFELPKTGNGLQLGVFTGLDFIAGNLYKNWVYSNRPWLSFGLSYNLLDRSNGKATPDKNTK